MFLRLTVLTAVLAMSCALAQSIPDTPAGRILRIWLDAFNSGDRARIEAYVQKYDPSANVDGLVNFRGQTGGFELVRVDISEPTRVVVRLKERSGTATAIGRLTITESDPPKVAQFGVRAIPPGVTDADFIIDAAARKRVIDGAAAKLNEFYVFPDVARKMEDAIRARLKAGEYESFNNGDEFAQKLTADLRAVSQDKHLGVNFNPASPGRSGPAGGQGPAPDPAAMRRQMERMNCGFEKAERLAPNIGYLKFNMFARADICGPTATAAMNFLGSVDALIIDLRENGGGDPRMVAYISSYLFDEKTHLNDLYNRKEDRTEEYWTTTDVPGKRLGSKPPVFVLTAKRTFSGAEEFSYNLQNLKRATIIGETTGGGAHPVSGHRLDDHFSIGVPFARAINPISKKNWEGTGVEPDVKVPAGDALEAAKKLASMKK